eukprot:TRINITY_DN5952_c0_g1_i1.p1 TRINITY_DN5952_c0_g1~~TRINITY_DN5952_c0_g1_i1.p1  ORF type:complete len:424 (+),score=78.72 TRINITY_DN5952_c0_g1_i1:78-1349(+)
MVPSSNFFQVNLKIGTISVLALSGSKLTTVYKNLRKNSRYDIKYKVLKKELPKSLLNTQCVVCLGNERVCSEYVEGDNNPNWVIDPLEIEIDELDIDSLELVVRVNNDLYDDLNKVRTVQLGSFSVKLRALVPSLLGNSELIETFPLSSTCVSLPGFVTVKITYKTHTILAPVLYEDFLKLLQKDDFFLTRALMNHRVMNDPILIKCLLSLFTSRGIVSEFVHVILNDYINNRQTFTEDLFRENSPCCNIIEQYIQYLCQGYVSKILEPFLLLLQEEKKNCEIFLPYLNRDKQLQSENIKNLIHYCLLLSNHILSSIDSVPEKVFFLFSFMSSCIKKMTSDWERIAQVSVSSFFFLRLWNYALTCPSAYGIKDPQIFRTCILLAKYLQTLASGSSFYGKEDYMMPLMEILKGSSGINAEYGRK